MKKLASIFCALALIVMLASCAMATAPVTGFVYSDVKSPVAVTGNSGSSKVGTAEATSILGIIGTGDASIQAAAKAAGITKIHHVDQHSTNILCLYAKYTIYVYGE